VALRPNFQKLLQARFQLVAAVFGIYSWLLENLDAEKWKNCIATGTAFSRQRKNIEAKSQFLVRMRILQLVEIGVLRSSHAGYHGTPCFLSSAKPTFPTAYFEGVSRYHPVSVCQTSTAESLLYTRPKHFRELLCRLALVAQG
jgi:hypothetical protein